MKTPLLITYLLLLTFLNSCKKEDLPHPLIGSWTHNSKTLNRGDLLQTLIFKDNGEGERLTKSSPVCPINDELITMAPTSLCNGIGVDDAYFVDDTNHFSWLAKRDSLEMNYIFETFETEFVVSTNFLSGALLLYEQDTIDTNEVTYKFTYKVNGSELLLITTFTGLYGGTKSDTLKYNRE